MLLDSNIIIYASQPPHAALRQFIATHAPAVSVVSYVEVLGYHRLRDQERLMSDIPSAAFTLSIQSNEPS